MRSALWGKSVWGKSVKVLVFSVSLAALVALIAAGAGQQINPRTQIRWPPSCNNDANQVYNLATNTCVSAGTASNPAGNNGNIQINNSGAFGAATGVNYDGSGGLQLSGTLEADTIAAATVNGVTNVDELPGDSCQEMQNGVNDAATSATLQGTAAGTLPQCGSGNGLIVGMDQAPAYGVPVTVNYTAPSITTWGGQIFFHGDNEHIFAMGNSGNDSNQGTKWAFRSDFVPPLYGAAVQVGDGHHDPQSWVAYFLRVDGNPNMVGPNNPVVELASTFYPYAENLYVNCTQASTQSPLKQLGMLLTDAIPGVYNVSAPAASGGTGYTSGTIQATGGTYSYPAVIQVTAAGGVIQSASVVTAGMYLSSSARPVFNLGSLGGSGGSLTFTFGLASGGTNGWGIFDGYNSVGCGVSLDLETYAGIAVASHTFRNSAIDTSYVGVAEGMYNTGSSANDNVFENYDVGLMPSSAAVTGVARLGGTVSISTAARNPELFGVGPGQYVSLTGATCPSGTQVNTISTVTSAGRDATGTVTVNMTYPLAVSAGDTVSVAGLTGWSNASANDNDPNSAVIVNAVTNAGATISYYSPGAVETFTTTNAKVATVPQLISAVPDTGTVRFTNSYQNAGPNETCTFPPPSLRTGPPDDDDQCPARLTPFLCALRRRFQRYERPNPTLTYFANVGTVVTGFFLNYASHTQVIGSNVEYAFGIPIQEPPGSMTIGVWQTINSTGTKLRGMSVANNDWASLNQNITRDSMEDISQGNFGQMDLRVAKIRLGRLNQGWIDSGEGTGATFARQVCVGSPGYEVEGCAWYDQTMHAQWYVGNGGPWAPNAIKLGPGAAAVLTANASAVSIGGAGSNTENLILADSNGGKGLGVAPGWDNLAKWQLKFGANAAGFTASITGTSMVVSSVGWGVLVAGQTISGPGVTNGTTITSGPGGVGTYVISPSQTVPGGTVMTSSGTYTQPTLTGSANNTILQAQGGFAQAGVLTDPNGISQLGWGTNGTYINRQMIAAGPAPSFSGTCNVTSPLGGNSAGKFTTTSTGSCTLIITTGATATNGTACRATDITADVAGVQTGSTGLTCTVTLSSVANGDTILWIVDRLF